MNRIKDTSIRVGLNSKDKEDFERYCKERGTLDSGLKATPTSVIREEYVLPLLEKWRKGEK